MEIILRSIALAGRVDVPPETPILPPQRRGRPIVGPALRRATRWLGAAFDKAGVQLTATVQDCLAAGCERPKA